MSAAATMMIIVVATKAAGFLRQFFYAYKFGASRELDMFIAANTLPEMIVNLLILGSVNAALIPVLFEAFDKEGGKKTKKLIRSIFTAFIIVLLFLSCLAFIFSRDLIEWSVRIADPKNEFTPQQIDQTVSMLKILLISPIILGFSNLATGVLHVYQRFIIPQLAPFLYNLGGLIAVYFLVPHLGVNGLAWGVLFGAVLHLAIQIPLLRFLKISLKPAVNFKNIYLIKIGRLMLPRIIGLAVGQVSLFVDRVLALGLVAGSASALIFAESIKIIPVSIFGLTIAAAAFPVLSRESAKKRFGEFKSTLVRSLNYIIFLAVPVTAIFVILRVPIVRLVLGLGSGKFTWDDTLTTAWVLLFFSIGMIAESIISLVIKAFYSLQDTKTPVLVSIGAIIFSIVTSIAFTNLFSHFVDFDLSNFVQHPSLILEWLVSRNNEQSPSVGGLALSASLTFTLEVCLLIYLLDRKVKGLGSGVFYLPVIKKLFIGILTGIVMYLIYSIWNSILNTTKTLNIFLLTASTSFAGMSIYVILSYIFNCSEVVILEKALVIVMNIIGNWQSYLKKTLGKAVYIEDME